MPGRVLLDTNVVIALFSGEKSVSQQFTATEVYVSATVLGGLYFGARKSAHAPANLAKIDQFAAVALQHGLPLATRDYHFQEVDSLQVKRW